MLMISNPNVYHGAIQLAADASKLLERIAETVRVASTVDTDFASSLGFRTLQPD